MAKLIEADEGEEGAEDVEGDGEGSDGEGME